jgi:drug/metabolite transporter (DMT)-like permease
MIGAVVLSVALASTAFAQLSYKLYFVRGRSMRMFGTALALFVLAQLGFFFALTRLEVGVVYMSTGLIHLLVMALSRFVLHEDISRDHLVAVAMIAAGLLVYAL